MANVKALLLNSKHGAWVVAQQVLVRGIVAIKFLVGARLLGPTQIALVGVALLALAMVEALSDTGLAHAVVQRNSSIDRKEAGAIWSLQMLRGAFLAFFLFVLSTPLSFFFGLPEASYLIALSAFVPLIRNSLNPGVFLAQRERNFRARCLVEVSAAVADISVMVVLVQSGVGPAAILVGTIVSESCRAAFSWSVLRVELTPTWDWKEISDLASFGKWVWGSSVITFFLNQLDKFLVVRFLGATEFGLYQVASRVAQLVVADSAIALGQYMYPTFSHKWRISKKEAVEFYEKIFFRVVVFAILAAALLIIFSSTLIPLVLGDDWNASVSVLRVMCLGMCFNAGIAVVVSFSRAVGSPRIVTSATFFQLAVLAVVGPLGVLFWGSVGMALSMSCSWMMALLYMRRKVSKVASPD